MVSTISTTAHYLTAPNAQKTQRTYCYKCELVSKELEFDSHSIPVPKDCETIELVATEPGVEAIEALIAATDWFSGYTIVSHWIPSDCSEF